MVHGLEIEYWGDVEFVYLNIDDANVQPFKEQFGFRYQPQLFLLDGAGNVVQEFRGAPSEEMLRTALDQLIQS